MVIDSNVYLTYIKNQKLYRLLNAIALYDIEVFVNDELISEISRNIPKVVKENSDSILASVMPLLNGATKKVDTIKSFSRSPDKKDNFIFDIAIQTNSSVIITQEKALLEFSESPVPVRDIKWFKERYPVSL